jgi:hypothetical protein
MKAIIYHTRYDVFVSSPAKGEQAAKERGCTEFVYLREPEGKGAPWPVLEEAIRLAKEPETILVIPHIRQYKRSPTFLKHLYPVHFVILDQPTITAETLTARIEREEARNAKQKPPAPHAQPPLTEERKKKMNEASARVCKAAAKAALAPLLEHLEAMRVLRQAGASWLEIAAWVNAKGLRTREGCLFTHHIIARYFNRLEKLEDEERQAVRD